MSPAAVIQRPGRSRCATSAAAALRPRHVPACRHPTQPRTIANVQAQLLHGARRECDLVGRTRARPASTTRGSTPFKRRVPNVGVPVPSIGIAHAHDASSAVATLSSRATARRSLSAIRPSTRRARSPRRCPTDGGSRRCPRSGAEREAGDDTQHADDGAEQRRADRHRPLAPTGLQREPRADQQGGRKPTGTTIPPSWVATPRPRSPRVRCHSAAAHAVRNTTDHERTAARPRTNQSAWSPTSSS